MDNIRTVYIDMPATVKAYTIAKDGFYTIVLNSQLSHQDNLASYQHELEHILLGDFDRRCSADLIEFYAHR